MPTIDEVLAQNLNHEQRAAASDRAREVLTLACAGSGKSRTLAYRIAWLLANGADPESIVAFTFTEKAAESIKLRVSQALMAAELDTNVMGRMFIGTIHSYCQYVLTQMDARYRQFEVLDENRLKLFLMTEFYRLGIQQLQQRHGGGYFKAINETADAWLTINEELLTPEDITPHDGDMAQVLHRIWVALDNSEYMDFSLMQRLVVDALVRGDAGARGAVGQLRHLLVDEYQDINPVQERLISLLHRDSETLFVVGDDDQSVYAWRGADVNQILTFQDRYETCAVHTLNVNYRSTGAIVAAADGFAAAELGATRIVKNPEAVEFNGLRDFRVTWFDDRPAEAAWVAERIQTLLGTAYRENDGTMRGLSRADFAILMRSTKTNEQTGRPRHAAFTDALNAAGIRYSIEAGGGLFDRPEVQALRSTFELLRNGQPDRNVARDHFDQVIRPSYPRADFNRFAAVLTEWGRLIHAPRDEARRRIYPQKLVHDLLAAFNLARSNLDDAVMRDIGVFSQIMQDVETVFMSVDSTARFQSILNFLQNVAENGYDSSTYEVSRRPDAVTISTVHKMKGLEFPVVFIVDVEAQRFPKKRSAYDGWLPGAAMQAAIARGAYQSTREEEARLFYTAMTRAERFLYISGCANLPGAARARKRSVFVANVAHPEISNDPAGLPAPLDRAPSARRIEDSDLPTSYSDIRYYLRCPKDYKFRKVYGFSPPVPDLFGFGLTVHAAIGRLHERYRDAAPTEAEAAASTEELFHVKHVPPSRNPDANPGPYERAQARAVEIVSQYARDYADDFSRRREVEARFEIPLEHAVISGAIDLMLHEDAAGNVIEASVIDFKTLEGGEDAAENEVVEWTELSLQVQLYAKAATEILGHAARQGHVHLLKDNQRVAIPITREAIAAAVANVEWVVDRIIHEDFPARPERNKCEACDFRQLCPKAPDQFATEATPPPIHVPGGGQRRMAAAFSVFDPHFRE